MMLGERKIKYIYNENTDCLNIYFGNAKKFYSDEEEKGIYKVYNEENDDLIAIEILYFSVRNKNRLSKILPYDIDWNSIVDKTKMNNIH